MKYLTIICSRNKILALAWSFIAVAGFTQKGTQSPYSVYGIGELNQGEYAAFLSMAGISVANSDSTVANYNNPAMYAYVQRYRPVLQVGMNGKYSVFSTTDARTTQQHLGLNQIQMAFPIKKRWGASFGLSPYSFTGYTITNFGISGNDTLNQSISEGSGAVSKVFLGVAYKPLNYAYRDTNYSKKDTTVVLKTHMISLGANGNYLFGNSSKTQAFEYLTSVASYNSRVISSLRITDVAADLGFNYQYYFRRIDTDTVMNGSVSFGASYSPGFKMRAYQDLFSHNYLGSFYGNSYTYIFDTVEYVTDYQGSVFIPDQYRIGLEYRMGWKPSRKGERLLRIASELNYQQWSAYYEDFGTPVYAPYLKDKLGLALGFEYCPVIGNDPSISILARTNYRLGFQYTQTELRLGGTDLLNYGMTFGLGIPVNVNSTNTSINLGASFGNMGTTDNGLINERYLGFYFGLSIIPDRNELWFVKRKYD